MDLMPGRMLPVFEFPPGGSYRVHSLFGVAICLQSYGRQGQHLDVPGHQSVLPCEGVDPGEQIDRFAQLFLCEKDACGEIDPASLQTWSMGLSGELAHHLNK